MSHFSGLVIMTPQYAEENCFEDSLDRYDENKSVPEYIAEDVDEYEKVSFLTHYNKEVIGEDKVVTKKFYEECKDAEGFFTKENLAEQWCRKVEDITDEKYIDATPYWNKELYANWFKSTYPEIWEKFDTCYEEYGQEWNSNTWRYHEGKLVRYSTYNPDSKWDWYSVGNRWDSCIKTKSGEFVNDCFLGEIDWEDFKPEDYCKKWEKDWKGNKYHPLKKSVKWHYNKNSVPFCVIIDGVWYERGSMGWWACVSNEKENWNEEFMKLIGELPEDSLVTNVDFHI